MMVSLLQECMFIIGILRNTEVHPYIKVTHNITAQRLSSLCKKISICSLRFNPSLKRNSQSRYFIELKCYSSI